MDALSSVGDTDRPCSVCQISDPSAEVFLTPHFDEQGKLLEESCVVTLCKNCMSDLGRPVRLIDSNARVLGMFKRKPGELIDTILDGSRAGR